MFDKCSAPCDFRMTRDIVKETIKAIDNADENWHWHAKVQKSKIKIFWQYLEELNDCPSPFVIEEGTEKEGNTNHDFIVLRNEHGKFLDGRILGEESFADGSLSRCSRSLMKSLQSIAKSRY